MKILLGLALWFAFAPPVADDPAAKAARAAGEPPLQVITARLGYELNPIKDEIPAQLFVRAGRGKVTHRPIAAFGLLKVCTSGWYKLTNERPEKVTLWQVGEKDNKQDNPPLAAGGKTTFDPGKSPFGLWVSTAGFQDETVCTEDAQQQFVLRFKPTDRHKAHVFAARRGGKIIPNTYLIGWEYSTNNDNQDIVTLVENVKPFK